MSDDHIDKKDELLRLLADAESKSRQLEDVGKDIVSSARLSRDVALPLHDLISQVPADDLPRDQLNRVIDSWHSWHRHASDLESCRTTVNSFAAGALDVTSTATGTITVMMGKSCPSSPTREVVERASAQLQNTLDRFPLVNEAKSSMRRLGLDFRKGGYQNALELLDQSCGALERPILGEGGTISVLIALRECILAAVTELLRRRPVQEPASKHRDKVLSLGRHCARPGLKDEHFERLASDAERLLNDFSGSKQADMSREQLRESFNRGLVFLTALLSSIDEKRLRAA